MTSSLRVVGLELQAFGGVSFTSPLFWVHAHELRTIHRKARSVTPEILFVFPVALVQGNKGHY